MRPLYGRQVTQKGEPNVHEVVLRGSGQPIRVPNPGGKSPATDPELGHAGTHVWPNPGEQIRATDPELGYAVTRLNDLEDPQTQALFGE